MSAQPVYYCFRTSCEFTLFIITLSSVCFKFSLTSENSNQLNNTNFQTKDNLSIAGVEEINHNFMVGVEDFRSLRLSSSAFVDKTRMINEVLERGGVVIIITRPRKWGKSVNMDMFKRFFDLEVDEFGNPLGEEDKKNRVLFTGGKVKLEGGGTKIIKRLKVTDYKSAMEHQGENPVISISFKHINGDNYQQFEDALSDRIRQLYESYPYLNQYFDNNSLPFLGKHFERPNRKEVTLSDSLLHLSKLLCKHFDQNVYILIDDYDVPIANAYIKFSTSSKDFDKVVELTYTIIGTALKDNWFLERALLSGTFHFGWINEILRLHNLVRHSTIVDSTFSEFYGFTKEEVEQVLKAVGMTERADSLKAWYNGYNLDGNSVYNPWSTLSCLTNEGKYDQYWGAVMESMSAMVDKIFLLDEAQESLHQMLQGRVIMKKGINKPINLLNIEETFHRILLFGGYFNPVPADCSYNCYIHPWNLSVPNREAQDLLAQGVGKWVANKLNLNLKQYNNLSNSFVSLDLDYFRETLQRSLVKSNMSKTALELQAKYHLLISGFLSSLAAKYSIESFRKPGQKSREYVLTAHPTQGRDAIIVEFEFSKSPKKIQLTVETGMKRLSGREYIKLRELKHVQQETKIYLALTKKKVALKYQISEVG